MTIADPVSILPWVRQQHFPSFPWRTTIICQDRLGTNTKKEPLKIQTTVAFSQGVNAPSVIAPSAEYSIVGGLEDPQTASAAIVSVSVDIANALPANQTYTLTTTLFDAEGVMVTRAVQTSVIDGGGAGNAGLFGAIPILKSSLC